MSGGSWQVWARSVSGVGAVDRLILLEISRFADGRGVAYVSIGHLMNVAHASRSTVFRALARMSDAGLVRRISRRRDRRQAVSRFELVNACGWWPQVVLPQKPRNASAMFVAPAPCPVGAQPVELNDVEGLRDAVRGAIEHGWDSMHGQVLALTLREYGRMQFWTLIARQLRWASPAASIDYVLSYAWEKLIRYAKEIASARNPWAKWTSCVAFIPPFVAHDANVAFSMDQVDEYVIADAKPIVPVVQGCEIGYDEVEGTFGHVVEALIDAGMNETLAWAGTLRVCEIAKTFSASHRHTIAGRDTRLVDEFGVPPHAARLWMTLITGAKRTVDRSVLDLPSDVLGGMVHDIVEETYTAA